VFVFILAAFSSTAFAAEPHYTGDPASFAWMLIDADSGEVLAFENADERIEPASTTKIMTLLVALEKGNLSDTVTISGHADRVGGSTCYLDAGLEVNLENLLTAMMIASGNDAATAVAEHIGGGSEQNFIDMMNAKAQELGMTNTHFVTPHGKHEEDHVTTASDMAILARAAMKNPTFKEIVDKSSYTLPENGEQYDNTNYLIRKDKEDDYYAYANGMKTGSTEEAGACLVASASKDNTNLIVLLFNDNEKDGDDRWKDAKSLFDFGFNNYKTIKLSEALKDTPPLQQTVENSSATDEKGGLLEFASPSEDTYVTLPNDVASGLINGSDSIEYDTVFTNGSTLQAPIVKDQVLGTVTYKSKKTGEPIYSGPLVASRDVLQAGTESSVKGGTAVATLPPTIPEQLVKKSDHSGIWLWLLIPLGLIGFLVFRLLTVNKKRRKRYSTRRKPQYSYKIRR
jgi:D-alanyl-D-alanine carboxypeptidase